MGLHVKAVLLIGVVLFVHEAVAASRDGYLISLLRSALQQQTSAQEERHIQAGCVLLNNPALPNDVNRANDIQGAVSFKQRLTGGDLTVSVSVTGIDTNSTVRHGFHVHESANLTDGCDSTGDHFNPLNKNHGAPFDDERHVGDFGNLERDASGNINATFTDGVASLIGPNTIIGKAIVLHEDTDDLGRGGDESSLTNGNAGLRLACCIIT